MCLPVCRVCMSYYKYKKNIIYTYTWSEQIPALTVQEYQPQRSERQNEHKIQSEGAPFSHQPTIIPINRLRHATINQIITCTSSCKGIYNPYYPPLVHNKKQQKMKKTCHQHIGASLTGKSNWHRKPCNTGRRERKQTQPCNTGRRDGRKTFCNTQRRRQNTEQTKDRSHQLYLQSSCYRRKSPESVFICLHTYVDIYAYIRDIYTRNRASTLPFHASIRSALR